MKDTIEFNLDIQSESSESEILEFVKTIDDKVDQFLSKLTADDSIIVTDPLTIAVMHSMAVLRELRSLTQDYNPVNTRFYPAVQQDIEYLKNSTYVGRLAYNGKDVKLYTLENDYYKQNEYKSYMRWALQQMRHYMNNPFVSVQPMSAPTGQIFTMNFMEKLAH